MQSLKVVFLLVAFLLLFFSCQDPTKIYYEADYIEETQGCAEAEFE